MSFLSTKTTPKRSPKESASLLPWGLHHRTTILLFFFLFSLWAVFWNLSFANGAVEKLIAERYFESSTVAEGEGQESVNHVLDFFHEIESATGGRSDSLELARDIYSIAARYLLREPRETLKSIRPPVVDIDCGDPVYARVLTGYAATEEKYIIDIVPFGFDVEYLEIRLMEYFDFVDKFIIFEQSTSLKGVPKQYLIPKLLASDRFSRFKSKIEYLPDDVPSEILDSIGSSVWAIEERFRTLPVEYLRKTMPNMTNAFVIQNDGDEIITRKVMAHFKTCEARPHFPIYTPALSHERNAAWLQETYDMRNMQISNKSLEVLKAVLWRPGPVIERYDDVLKAGDTKASRTYVNAGTPNFGLGAANHFSTPAHPILSLLKTLSTSDSAPHHFSPEFWPTVRNGTVSEQDIMVELFLCRSTGQYRWIHVGEFEPWVRTFVVKHLPWAVQENPSRYAWLYSPTLFAKEKELYKRICD
jgi:hypothetical protein